MTNLSLHSDLSEVDHRRTYPVKIATRLTPGYGHTGYYGPQYFESFSESQAPSRHRKLFTHHFEIFLKF